MDLDSVEEAVRETDLPLEDQAKSLVFGRGEADAEYMFIGEAPGEHEDVEGEPFVGRAGSELDSLLDDADISSYYIANVLKYRPPDNRDPTQGEVEAHAPFLRDQVLAIMPRIIVPLGNVATQFVLAGFSSSGEVGRISDVRGSFHSVVLEGETFRILPTYHPAAMLYNPGYRTDVERDFEKLTQSSLDAF